MIILFNCMQSSLSMVYDREMGSMKVLLMSPIPRAFLLFSKLVAGAILSTLQVLIFLFVTRLVGVDIELWGSVELLRFALYGQVNTLALSVVLAASIVSSVIALGTFRGRA